MNPSTPAINPNADLKMAAQLKFASNGEDAKTAKVSVVARSREVVDTPWFGPMVHDFDGMSAKSKIPLDYNHDQTDSIGYLNKFDTSTGELVCSGAVVLTDDVSDLITKMQNGVPYEASIQFGNDCLLEFVPEGYTATINNNSKPTTVQGPVTIVRQWALMAVAVCKFGMDSDTSTDLVMSTKPESKKGFFIQISKQKHMEKLNMSKIDNVIIEKQEQAEVKAATVETPVEASKAVETVVKVETSPMLSATPVEAVKAVEAEKVKEETKEVAAPAAMEMAKSEADPRAEFKQFVTEFGAELAGNYFAQGKSFSEACALFAKDIKTENESLKKRLAALDRGAAKPLAFSDSMKQEDSDATAKDAPKGMAAVIRRAQPAPKKTR